MFVIYIRLIDSPAIYEWVEIARFATLNEAAHMLAKLLARMYRTDSKMMPEFVFKIVQTTP